MTLEDCDFNKEAAVGLLQAVGDRRLSLTITYEYMYVIILIVVYILCIAIIVFFIGTLMHSHLWMLSVLSLCLV